MSRSIIKLTIIALCFVPASMFAQSACDNYFSTGVKQQQTMTVSSQWSAISNFEKAKECYDSESKKELCDQQIKACRNIIAQLNKTAEAETTKKAEAKQEVVVMEEASKEPEPAPRTDIELKLSESRLDFKYKPKEGATQSVEVTCNYDDWKIKSQPDWVTIYTAAAKFSVEAAENTTEEERSGVITVSCGDKDVDLVVNQAKANKFQKIKNIIKK